MRKYQHQIRWYKPGGKVFDEEFLKHCKKFLPRKVAIEEVRFIERILKLKPKMKILDLACGWGRHSIELARRGYEVVGQDINPFYLREAKRLAKETNVKIRWVKSDMRKIPFKSEFDAILNISNSFGYFEKEEDNKRVISEVAKALKPGGIFFLDVRHLECLLYQYQPKNRIQFDKEHFAIVESSLDFLKSRWNERVINFWKNKKRRESYYSIRTFTVRELISLYQEAGLFFKKIYGNYKGDPMNFNAERCILIAQKVKR